MDTNIPITKPLSIEDKTTLQKLRSAAWIRLLKLYVPLFLALIWLYYRMQPGMTFKGHTLKGSVSDFKTTFYVFAAVFGSVFLFFTIRDFKRLILPFQKEAKNDTKYCHTFFARKYHDLIYNKYLLFYPGKEDLYIEVTPEDFEAVANGEEMYLEVASVTGEVLFLKKGDRIFKEPMEFSFSDK